MTFEQLARIKQRITDGYYDDDRWDESIKTLFGMIADLQTHGYRDNDVLRLLKLNTGMSSETIARRLLDGDKN